MARIRTIKPEFWTDSLMVQLPHFTRLLYIALWNIADDHGFIRDEPERIAMELMPREPALDVDAALQLLVASSRLDWYVSDDGFSYYKVAHWEDHQRVDHPAKSKVSREGSRKLSISNVVRREVAIKYGCSPGEIKDVSCYYCGRPGRVHWFRLNDGRPSGWIVFPELELDHLEPEANGGETSSENIVLACRSCNRGKGTKQWFDFFSSRVLVNPREIIRELAPDQGREGIKDQGEEETLSGKPDVIPPNGTHHLKTEAISVLGYLNEKAGRSYRAGDANLDLIIARLKEGATEAELRAVIDSKCAQWLGDEKMAYCLRPATLFNKTKFAQYQGEVGVKAPKPEARW